MTEVLDDLIACGVDALLPIQAGTMDDKAVAARYSGRVAFWIGMDVQQIIPFATPDEVRATVKHMCETVGDGGGLVLAPTHVLEPDVPWENIMAFFDAIEEYGQLD